MKKLWNYFDGEPFLTNPPVRRNPLLAITNPLKYRKRLAAGRYEYDYISIKKKGKKKMRKNRMPAGLRRYWAKHRRGRRRRNAIPLAGLAVNPRRRRKSSYRRRRNPIYRRRRNPSLMGFKLPPLQSVLYVGAGLAGTPMIERFIAPFVPMTFQTTTLGRYVIRIASVLGLSFLVRKALGPNQGNMVAIGGGAYVLTTALAEFAPTLGLGRPSLGAYVGAPGLGAYVRSSGRTYSTLGNYSANGPMLPPVARNASNRALTPSRFRRF